MKSVINAGEKTFVKENDLRDCNEKYTGASLHILNCMSRQFVKPTCLFCNKEDHKTQNHKIVTHNENKENIVKDILFIWKVLRHFPKYCTSSIKCSNCSERHHLALWESPPKIQGNNGNPPPRSSCPEVFCKKDVLKNLAKFTGKYLCHSLFFNKVADLSSVTLFKRRLWHRCIPVNFAKFLRTLIFIENLCRLLLTTYCRIEIGLLQTTITTSAPKFKFCFIMTIEHLSVPQNWETNNCYLKKIQEKFLWKSLGLKFKLLKRK